MAAAQQGDKATAGLGPWPPPLSSPSPPLRRLFQAAQRISRTACDSKAVAPPDMPFSGQAGELFASPPRDLQPGLPQASSIGPRCRREASRSTHHVGRSAAVPRAGFSLRNGEVHGRPLLPLLPLPPLPPTEARPGASHRRHLAGAAGEGPPWDAGGGESGGATPWSLSLRPRRGGPSKLCRARKGRGPHDPGKLARLQPAKPTERGARAPPGGAFSWEMERRGPDQSYRGQRQTDESSTWDWVLAASPLQRMQSPVLELCPQPRLCPSGSPNASHRLGKTLAPVR